MKSINLNVCNSRNASDSSTFKKLAFNTAGYNKYGLYYHDIFEPRHPHLNEALRRLPEKERMERKYRAIIAAQCEITHKYLPKEQWTKFEDVCHIFNASNFTLC